MVRNKKSKASEKDETGALFCCRCSYSWKPRSIQNLPKNCPSCRSTVWMKPFEYLLCTRCGHEWKSTSDEPRRCPLCGTYKWNETPTVHNCIKCNHSWNAKRDWPPKRCPFCRSTTWGYREEEKSNKKDKKVRANYMGVISEEDTRYILDRYARGDSCTKISLTSGIPFSIVYDVIFRTEETAPIKV
jgi:Primosomal protein N'' (replication factor Y) - superfamily II helicase